MWISGILLRGTMKICPQAGVENLRLFHRGCGGAECERFLHRKSFNIPQDLLIKIVYVTFLSLNKKVTKEISLRGATSKCAPLGIPRRFSDRYLWFESAAERKSGHFRVIL